MGGFNKLAAAAATVALILGAFSVKAQASGLSWENVSAEITDVNAVLIDRLNPKYLCIGSGRGVFASRDGGLTWRKDANLNQRVNLLFQDRRATLYALAENGLYFSQDQGKTWKRAFRLKGSTQNNYYCLAASKANRLYLGTQEGLFISEDAGRSWQRAEGRVGNQPIFSIAVDATNNSAYAVGENEVFKTQEEFKSYTSVFTMGSAGSNDEQYTEIEDEGFPLPQVRWVSLDFNRPGRIFLAAATGVYKSTDGGLNWEALPDYGLLSKDVRFILSSPGSSIYAVTKAGIFLYENERWQQVSDRLPVNQIRSLSVDSQGSLFAATDKGLFRAVRGSLFYGREEPAEYFKDEPKIREVQEAAIKYAEVIDPRRIENLRIQARLKAILPTLNLKYDKTITSYSNSSLTRFVIGPQDWGVTLKWDLSDLIWSDQQRLIDSQVRLAVVLRNNILDEVNKVYFERRKVKMELDSLPPENTRKIQEKKLRLEELTASLDALTGGYFSLKIGS